MLVSMKDILERASRENYAVAAPNISMELEARAMLEAAEELKSPIILDVLYTATPDILLLGDYLTRLADQASVPVAINLDHGAEFYQAVMAIKAGFTSIMIDRSVLPFEENVAQVSELVKIAHAVGVSVEAELGHVGQGTNYKADRNAALTDSHQAKEYVQRTGVDCLAIAIGTAHGSYAGTGVKPYLDFERLHEIKEVLGNDFPLVLHGGSGTGDENLAKAAGMGINKINIANDLYTAATRGIEEAHMIGNGTYEVYNVAKQSEKDLIKKYIKLFGSEGKAWTKERGGLGVVATTNVEK